MEPIKNINDSLIWSHAHEKVRAGHGNIKFGLIINVKRSNHLALTYAVKLYDAGGLVLENCKLASSESGYNGTGVANPLDEGTPVILACKSGILEDAVIIGCFNTEGVYKEFYEEGKLQKPSQTEGGAEFNQPSGHPNRITQEDSYFQVVRGKTLNGPYDSPEYHVDPGEKLEARSMPSSILMKNQGGDVVQYTMGSNVIYSDGNIVQVSGGDREQKSTKMLRLAAMHSKRADLIGGVTGTGATSATTGITPIAPGRSVKDPAEAIPDSYRVTEERKLADLYKQAAQGQNQSAISRGLESNRLKERFDSELSIVGNLNDGSTGSPTKSTFAPKQERAVVNPGNFTSRTPSKYQPVLVVHSTGGAQSTIDTLGQSGNASYHALIKQDGTIVNLVDFKNKALGAANSSFNGEQESGSIDNFANQIALEAPNSLYTEAQYKALAYLTKELGIKVDRITTHDQVDTRGVSTDPANFSLTKLKQYVGNQGG